MKTFFRNNIKESLASAFFVVCFVCSFLSCSNDYCKDKVSISLRLVGEEAGNIEVNEDHGEHTDVSANPCKRSHAFSNALIL